MERLTMGIDGRLYVSCKLGIRCGRITELCFMRLCEGDALADLPAGLPRRLNNGHRTMVLLHDNFQTFLDLWPARNGCRVRVRLL